MAVKGIKGNTDRLRLEEHIPLDTPLRVFIDVSSFCNFHCSFCPHGNGEAAKVMPQAIMPVDLAFKCIDDLKSFPQKIKMLSFFCFGEPLLHKNISDFIQYASNQKVAEQLEITTNASLLTPALSDKLVSAGLTLINISLYGITSSDYQSFCNVTIDYDLLVQNIKYLHSVAENTKIIVKICDTALENPAKKELFYRIFEPICDKICLELPVPFWYDLDNNIEDKGIDIYGNPVTRKAICPVPFYTMCINANGIVTPCCSDWKNRLQMGDSKKQSLVSIWRGQKYKDFCIGLLKGGNAAMYPCKYCHFHEFVAMDNIDPYREQLLKKLENDNVI